METQATVRRGRAVAIAAVAAALAAADLRAALVANWRLDDTAAPAVCDVTSTYNGTYEGALAANQAGRIGTAYAFTGGGVKVDPNGSAAPPAPAVSPLGTVSAWVKPNAGAWTGNIVYNQNPTFIQFRLEDIGSGKRLVYRQDGGRDRIVNGSYGAVADGVWTHVVATVAPSEIQLFVNGTVNGTGGGSNSYVTSNSTFLQIGAGAGHNFSGLIDDVAIWDTVLSPGRIGTLANILTVDGGALGDYNAFRMNSLFEAYDTSTVQPVTSNAGTLLWEKFVGASGTAGSVTFDGERYNAWFDGTSGVSALVPEPATCLFAGLAGLTVIAGLARGRRRLRSRERAA